MWDKIKDWCKRSATIALARLQMIGAAALAVFASFDLSPLVAAGIPSKQQWALYGVLFTQGLMTEIARRRTL